MPILEQPFAAVAAIVLRTLLCGVRSDQARFRLGQIYTLGRQCAHESELCTIRKKYDVHPTVTSGFDTVLHGDGKILIKEHTYLGRDTFIVSHPAEAKIVIGKHCAISHSVHIRTANYKTNVHFKEALESRFNWGDVVIGDYVWIGAHVVILGGVTIGENSVIGANSVVTRDMPANSICAGVPVRVLHYKTDSQEEAFKAEPFTHYRDRNDRSS